MEVHSCNLWFHASVRKHQWEAKEKDSADFKFLRTFKFYNGLNASANQALTTAPGQEADGQTAGSAAKSNTVRDFYSRGEGVEVVGVPTIYHPR